MARGDNPPLHHDWKAFRPWFSHKYVKNAEGKHVKAYPHPDWVKNVFIPRCEKARHENEKARKRREAKRIDMDKDAARRLSRDSGMES